MPIQNTQNLHFLHKEPSRIFSGQPHKIVEERLEAEAEFETKPISDIILLFAINLSLEVRSMLLLYGARA